LWREMTEAGRVVEPSREEIAQAWQAYERMPSGGPGVVDLLSFRAMERLRLRRAFTNDRHFRTAGFEVLF
ncbi:MAG TPA: nucleic acid-binding protein, partial [Thermoanaerobaculia bacterium]|nr:nucleic acid-binding protein [Thermoanaerobaculia bacterium]